MATGGRPLETLCARAWRCDWCPGVAAFDASACWYEAAHCEASARRYAVDADRASRLLNRLTAGRRGELFCARVHRRGWRRIARLIDAAFHRRRGDVDHCAATWLRALREAGGF